MLMDTERTAVLRQMLRDLVQCGEFDALSVRLGLVPASAEVADAEHQASHVRLETLFGLMEDAGRYAEVAAELMLRLSAADSPDEPHLARYPQYCAIARASAMLVIAQLCDSGRLEVPE